MHHGDKIFGKAKKTKGITSYFLKDIEEALHPNKNVLA